VNYTVKLSVAFGNKKRETEKGVTKKVARYS